MEGGTPGRSQDAGAQLAQLSELHRQGVLSDKEYDAAVARAATLPSPSPDELREGSDPPSMLETRGLRSTADQDSSTSLGDKDDRSSVLDQFVGWLAVDWFRRGISVLIGGVLVVLLVSVGVQKILGDSPGRTSPSSLITSASATAYDPQATIAYAQANFSTNFCASSTAALQAGFPMERQRESYATTWNYPGTHPAEIDPLQLFDWYWHHCVELGY
jgi:hypothetical protein